MKYKSLLALASLLISPALRAAESPKPFGGVVSGYELAWSDEFDGTALDLNKWIYRTDSKHWSTQLPANVSLKDGCLRLAVRKEESGKMHYTGAGVISRESFLYGYYEARYKVPPGSGWHTSFWAMMHNGKGGTEPPRVQEIDFCEQDSVNLNDYSGGVIDWSTPKSRQFGRKHVKTPDLSADFHVWACEFTPMTVNFYFDGKLTHSTDATKFPHGPQQIWLTTIASHYGNTKSVDNTRLPAEAVFDYVRFYKKIVSR